MAAADAEYATFFVQGYRTIVFNDLYARAGNRGTAGYFANIKFAPRISDFPSEYLVKKKKSNL